MELVRHVGSGWVLRNRHEELSVVIGELGFTKRGSRIVTAPNEPGVRARERAAGAPGLVAPPL